MQRAKIAAGTLFVMVCVLLQAVVSFAQGELRISDQSKLPDYARIDIQSLNEINARASQMNPQEKKESFKFFILSTGFQPKLDRHNTDKINGRFDKGLLRSIAQLMIEEMETIDRLSPFSVYTMMLGAPKFDVAEVWDCLWINTVMGEMNGSADYIQKCSQELMKKSSMSEEKATQLITSMSVVFKTIHLFNRMGYQALLGEDHSPVFTKLWGSGEKFYNRFVRGIYVSDFKSNFLTGILRMGALDAQRKAKYEWAMQLLKKASDNGDEQTLKIYRETFIKAGFYIPPELREKE